MDSTGRSFMDDVGNAAGAVADFTRGAVSATKNAINGVTGTISRTVDEIRDTFHAIACDPVGYFNSLSISEKIIVGTVGGLAAEAAVKMLVGIIRGTTLESFMDESGQMSFGDDVAEDVYKGSRDVGNITEKLDTNNIPNMTKQDIIDNIPNDWNYTDHSDLSILGMQTKKCVLELTHQIE